MCFSALESESMRTSIHSKFRVMLRAKIGRRSCQSVPLFVTRGSSIHASYSHPLIGQSKPKSSGKANEKNDVLKLSKCSNSTGCLHFTVSINHFLSLIYNW